MDNGGPSQRSFGGGNRGNFRAGPQRSRDDSYIGRGRDAGPTRGAFRGRRGSPRGGGGDSRGAGGRFGGDRFRDQQPSYATRDFGSSRPPQRDYRATLTPPLDKDRRYAAGPMYDREPASYRLDRSDFRPTTRGGMGPRDYATPRDYPPMRDYPSMRQGDRADARDFADARDYPRSAGRGYPSATAGAGGRRYSFDMPRDVGGRSDSFRGRGGRYDVSPPRSARRYSPGPATLPRSYGGGPQVDDYPPVRREGMRTMSMRGPPGDDYPPRDDRGARDMRQRRPPSPHFDMDAPTVKRMRDGPPPMSSRGGGRPRSPLMRGGGASRGGPLRGGMRGGPSSRGSGRGGPPRRF